MLTIISVVYGDPSFWKRNLHLARALNPKGGFRWLVVDNSPEPVVDDPGEPDVTVIPGVARPDARDYGSRHHAMGIHRALGHVDTRYLLVLDHDFFPVMPGWVGAIMRHAASRDLAFFGAPWHPRWSWQQADFPSVHCMLVDLEACPPGELDFLPSIDSDRYWHWINKPRRYLPETLRLRLKVGRIRDTGWSVRQRFAGATGAVELLTPVYARPQSRGAAIERRFDAVLPDRWKLYPPAGRRLREAGFLAATVPEAVEAGWEEFYWNDRPFGFHLRRVGRSIFDDPLEDDIAMLDRVISAHG